jgi:hypothetical protein
VVNQNEDKVISFFNRSSSFRLAQEIDDFNIYTIPSYQSSWIEFDSTKADITVNSFKADSITLNVNSVSTPTPVLVKLAYYPLWKASIEKLKIQNSKFKIDLNSDEIGLMHLVLPQGERYQVNLTYRTSWAKKAGDIITFLSFLAIFASLIISKRKKTIPTRSL